MCYHQLYIFMHCGHIILKPEPSPPLCPRALAFAAQSTASGSSKQRVPLPPVSTLPHQPPHSQGARPRNRYLRLFPTPCEPHTHPFRANKIERLCLSCTREKDRRLKEVETEQEVRFEDWKWKVAYRNPQAETKGWKSWGNAASAWDYAGSIRVERSSFRSGMGVSDAGEPFGNVWGTDPW